MARSTARNGSSVRGKGTWCDRAGHRLAEAAEARAEAAAAMAEALAEAAEAREAGEA